MKELLIKNKFYILAVIALILLLGNCRKSRQIKMSDIESGKKIEILEDAVDSLKHIVNIQSKSIDSFPERLRSRELDVHMFYDDWISDRDRGRQLMELHRIVKENIRELD